MNRGVWRATVHGVGTKFGHDLATKITITYIYVYNAYINTHTHKYTYIYTHTHTHTRTHTHHAYIKVSTRVHTMETENDLLWDREADGQ